MISSLLPYPSFPSFHSPHPSQHPFTFSYLIYSALPFSFSPFLPYFLILFLYHPVLSFLPYFNILSFTHFIASTFSSIFNSSSCYPSLSHCYTLPSMHSCLSPFVFSSPSLSLSISPPSLCLHTSYISSLPPAFLPLLLLLLLFLSLPSINFQFSPSSLLSLFSRMCLSS